MMEKEIKAFDEWIAKDYTDNEQKFNSLVQYHGMETTSAFYSGYHNRDEELTRLYEENERLRKNLQAALEWMIVDLEVQDIFDEGQDQTYDERIAKKYGEEVAQWLVNMKRTQVSLTDSIKKALNAEQGSEVMNKKPATLVKALPPPISTRSR